MRVSGLTDDMFELAADVVVVGSGAAGSAAAAIAAAGGASVLLLERAEQLGGTTALSGAGAWIPNNTLMRGRGIEDPRPEALRYMTSLSFPHLYDPSGPTLGVPAEDYGLIETYYDQGSAAIDALTAIGAVEFEVDEASPDYHVEHPDNAAPRGRLLRPAIGGSGSHSGGQLLVERMASVTRSHGGQVCTAHRAVGLLLNEVGECVGLEVRAGHRTILVRARRAVIFGSGGFLHNARLRRDHLLGPTFGGCASPGSEGDFLRAASAIGAATAHLRHAWWYQVVLDHTLDDSHTAGGFFMPFGDSMIQVNRCGHRVLDEKGPYNERGPVHFAWDGREYRNLVLFAIYDDAVAQNPEASPIRYPLPMPGERVNYVLSGATLEELEGQIRARLDEVRAATGGLQLASDFGEQLRATVERFNGFAVAGVDEDFGRGSRTIRESWVGEPRPGTKATMHPFADTGPYHAMLLVAGALDTKGGPRINTRSQVVDQAGQPIPGLYGAGNCVGSPTGQGYWGPGATIGAALTFGWIAGCQALGEPEKGL